MTWRNCFWSTTKCDLSTLSHNEFEILDRALIYKSKTEHMLLEHRTFNWNAEMGDGWRLPHAAVIREHNNIVTTLMKTKQYETTKLTKDGESMLTLHINYNYRAKRWLNSIRKDFSDVFDVLVASREVLTAVKHTLAAAVQQLPVHMCERMLANGADVNSSYPDNETALHCAIRLNSLRKIQLLLKYKADRNIKWLGLNPLQYAITCGRNPQILKLLSENVRIEVIESYLTQLSYPKETPLLHSQRLGVEEWTTFFTQRSNSNIVNYSSKNTFFDSPCSKLLLDTPSETISSSIFQHHAFTCHMLESHRNETKKIVNKVIDVAKTIASEIRKINSRYHFNPCLGRQHGRGQQDPQSRRNRFNVFF